MFPRKEIEDRQNDYVETKEPTFGPSPLITFGFNNKSGSQYIMEKLFLRENLPKGLEKA